MLGNMKKYILLIFILSTTWLLMSGIYTWTINLLGATSVIIVLYLMNRLKLFSWDFSMFFVVLNYMFFYFPWLVKEILISAIATALIILNPRSRPKSKSGEVKMLQETAFGKLIFSSSITLTPGTVTISIAKNKVLIHALDQSSISNVSSGRMNRVVAKFEGK